MVESADGIGEFLEDLKKNTFQKYDAFTVAEVFNMKEGELAEFIGEDGHFSTIFDFSAHSLSDGEHGWYDAPRIDFKKWRKTVIDSQLTIQECGFEANIIENHDEPRGVSRFLPEYARTPAGTKMLGTVSILLRGIPFIYQGQEIGMQNAGFTTGTPWLKVNDNYKEINVASQEKDADSVLNYYRRLVAVRKSKEYREVFTYGRFVPVYQDTETIMAFYRENENQRILVAANFGKNAVEVKLEYAVKRVILSNRNRLEKPEQMLRLESCEVIVLECDNTA